MRLLNFKTAPDGTKICYCNDVTLGEIRAAIKDGAKSVDDIRDMTGACTGNRCEELNPSGGCCETDILRVLSACTGSTGPSEKCKRCG
jgi:NAD(P)H-nitrite reductase large subunit